MNVNGYPLDYIKPMVKSEAWALAGVYLVLLLQPVQPLSNAQTWGVIILGAAHLLATGAKDLGKRAAVVRGRLEVETEAAARPVVTVVEGGK